MFFSFFVFPGLWFWLLVLAELGFLGFFVYEERGIPSTVAITIFALLILFLGDKGIAPFIRDNPVLILKICGGYFVGAVVYAFVKFWLKLQDEKRYYLRDKEQEYSSPSVRGFEDIFSSVAFWMAYWPICLFFTFFKDFVYRFFKGLSNSISSAFKKMYNHVLGDILKEIEERKTAEKADREANI